jgi:hypothetical protein
VIALLLLGAAAFGLTMLYVGIAIGRRWDDVDEPVEWVEPPASHVRVVTPLLAIPPNVPMPEGLSPDAQRVWRALQGRPPFYDWEVEA